MVELRKIVSQPVEKIVSIEDLQCEDIIECDGNYYLILDVDGYVTYYCFGNGRTYYRCSIEYAHELFKSPIYLCKATLNVERQIIK